MPFSLEHLARLYAYKDQQAVPITSHRHVALHPTPCFFCPLCMAGEDLALHIVLFGQGWTLPRVFWVPDPRHREDLFSLYSRLGHAFEAYFRFCASQHTFPQVWVSSGATVALIEMLADGLRFSSAGPGVPRLGELLYYLALRSGIAGQQTLANAPLLLSQHWATGQQPEEDQHLGSVLAWLYPPLDSSIYDALEKVERMPAGIKTDPAFDRDVLAPLIQQYHRICKQKGPSSLRLRAATTIRDALLPVVKPIYLQTARAYRTLQQSGLPPLPSLPKLEAQETASFETFLELLDQGHRYALQDTWKTALYSMSQRVAAEEQIQSILTSEDAFWKGNAILQGRILQGCVSASPGGSPGDISRTAHPVLYVWSAQRELHLREGDLLYWMKDPRLMCYVESLQCIASGTMVTLHVIKGMRATVYPQPGEDVELTPWKVDWNKWERERWQLTCHLAQKGSFPLWARGIAAVPSAPMSLAENYRCVPLPANPLQLFQERE